MPAIEVANLPKRYGDTVATVGLTVMPAYLSTYRERGVLRRLATTPASPNHLLTASMTRLVSTSRDLGAVGRARGWVLIFPEWSAADSTTAAQGTREGHPRWRSS